MKPKIILSLFFILCTYLMQAQSSEVEIFTADSKLFTLYVDGVEINTSPLSNVKFSSTKTDNLDIRIVFEENAAILEKKGVQMISNANRFSYTNGAKIIYMLENKNGTYVMNQTSVTNKPASDQTKIID